MPKDRSAVEGRIIRPAIFAQARVIPEIQPSIQTVIAFPVHSQPKAAVGNPGWRGLNRMGLLGLVVVAHIFILAIAILLSAHPVPTYDPDKVIDLMDMAEMAPPPTLQPIQKPVPINVPDAQRLQVKDEAKPPVPVEPATANTNRSDNTDTGSAENFLPQSQLDELPVFPHKLIKSGVEYPEMAKKMGLEGLVILQLSIDENGNILQIAVLKDPGHGFAEAAKKAFAGITIPPIKAGGKPARYSWRYPMRFTLK